MDRFEDDLAQKTGDDKAARRSTQALERSGEYHTISSSGFGVASRGNGRTLEIG